MWKLLGVVSSAACSIWRTLTGLLILAELLLFGPAAVAAVVSDYAVLVSAEVQANPPQIMLSWPADPQATGYTVYRKDRDASSWGRATSLPSSASSFTDSDVKIGDAFEYRVTRTSTAGVPGEGYVYAGLQAPLADNRGKVILLVESSVAPALATELATLEQDLAGDGWTVQRHDVSRSAGVTEVKNIIVTDYNADPANVRSVFLFGHIPVPYSGNFAPDGHPDHIGAWPADAFYGDIDGNWTDSQVTTASANDGRNWNSPGDGKFDQTDLPSDVELEVGRVDLCNLPAFPKSEVELLRQYLNKDHQFRQGQLQVERRALIKDGFGVFNGEAFAVGGWRSFSSFFGAPNVVPGDWLGTLSNNSYLCGYGSGPGTFTTILGLANTAALATNDPQVVFTMWFGSYIADWDSEDNFLRAQLATPTYTLTSAWSGRPNLELHHMGLGETIGYSIRLSQNNSTLYAANNNARRVHVALMGDPTLRLHPLAPPTFVSAVRNNTGGADITWRASAAPVLGYHVYRAASAAGPFRRLTDVPIASGSYTDTSAASPGSVYMVRAVNLETSASGSYFNSSQGAFQTLVEKDPRPSIPPTLSLSAPSPGQYLLTGKGSAGRTYQIQAVGLLTAGDWQTIGSTTADSEGEFSYIDACGETGRAYRTVSSD